MTSRFGFRIESVRDREKARLCADRAPMGWFVEYRAPTRSLLQNDRMWAHLDDIARQYKWDGECLTSDEYKDLFTAALRKQKIVRGIEGGLVCVGGHTSSMTIPEMVDLITLIEAFAAERGIALRDPQNRNEELESAAPSSLSGDAEGGARETDTNSMGGQADARAASELGAA